MSEMALTTGEKGRGKARAEARAKGKEKGSAGSRGSVATKGEAAKAAGRKGPTNGVTEGSSGSCRRHDQRRNNPDKD